MADACASVSDCTVRRHFRELRQVVVINNDLKLECLITVCSIGDNRNDFYG